MKKTLSFLIAMVILCMTICVPFSANAAVDTGSSARGFTIDTSEYNAVSWRSTRYRYFSVSTNKGTISVGTETVDVGTTTAKSKVDYNGMKWFLDAIVIRASYRGSGAKTYYGYIDDNTFEVNVGSNNVLWGYSPTQTASSISYTIGGEGGASFSKGGPEISLGISGSQSFQKDALTIRDKSNLSKQICKLVFDYDNNITFRWNSSFMRYSYDTSYQKMVVNSISQTPKYEVKITNTVVLDLWDQEPGWWMDRWGNYSNLTYTLSWNVSVCH